jgi:hypothetical protein
MSIRNNSLLIDNQLRFMLGLRKRQEQKDRTIDEICCSDLKAKYLSEHPEWEQAWEKRETLRQQHKNDLERLELEAIKNLAEGEQGL